MPGLEQSASGLSHINVKSDVFETVDVGVQSKGASQTPFSCFNMLAVRPHLAKIVAGGGLFAQLACPFEVVRSFY